MPGGSGTRVSFHSTSTCWRSSGVSSGSPERRCSGAATTPSSSTRRCPSIRATVAARTGRCCIQRPPPSPSGVSCSTSVSSNLAMAPACASKRAQRQPGEREVRGRRVLELEHHLEQRRAAEIALGLELLHQLLEGHVLVGVGPQRHLAHARAAARGTSASPETARVRSTSVLTKKPMSASAPRGCGRRWASQR